ncbi:MAG: ORC1-type DNA replication protein [Nanoarchaeota archaeon]|nr:ORC1-type DNA replication protein [Nanoarchaeota archaeon]MBU2441071.1 ORC1-type DNA replication protein [Nanoarchaeota archaeon]
MMKKEENNIFEQFLKKESLFKDKKVLQSGYIPDEINHRDEQITQIANILAPALRMEKPSNVFIYGKTGTGKTLSVRYLAEQMKTLAYNKKISLKIIYANCKLKKIADTEYRLIAQLAREFGKEIPPTGLPTDEVYNIFFQALEEEKGTIIFILDEIDQLIKKAGDEIIYNLTRINSELKESQTTLVGISNDLIFSNNLDPRVKSSLSEEEVIFPPYNAVQLQNILKRRAKEAFKDGVLGEGVLQKCAAYAAREHGDARRALELLRVAGELAERKGHNIITMNNIDEAENIIEKDRVLELIKNQPKQFQATLYSIIINKNNSKNKFIQTGDVYDTYRQFCGKIGLRPLTQRRISDIIAELDMMGIINAKVISKGRFGRTRDINLILPVSIELKIKKILEDDLFG